MGEGIYIVEALLRRGRERMISVRHVDDCKCDFLSRLCMDLFSVYILMNDDLPH